MGVRGIFGQKMKGSCVEGVGEDGNVDYWCMPKETSIPRVPVTTPRFLDMDVCYPLRGTVHDARKFNCRLSLPPIATAVDLR